MNTRQAIRRELRNASRVVSNADKFSASLLETAWAVIRSAARSNVFLDAGPYRRTCRAYEPDEPVRPTHKITS
jgi:hypothetical protein